jgi:5-methylcytosine-specific restriction endonuclease McrA
MPRIGKENLICPILLNQDFIECFEYNKEKEKDIKRQERKKQYFPNKEQRTFIPKEWRIRVARDAKFKCCYCGRYQNQRDEIGKKIRMVIDHFIPLAHGGTSNIANLVCSCFECNASKGANIWEKNCRAGYYSEYKGSVWN